jgi:hypothetical protein
VNEEYEGKAYNDGPIWAEVFARPGVKREAVLYAFGVKTIVVVFPDDRAVLLRRWDEDRRETAQEMTRPEALAWFKSDLETAADDLTRILRNPAERA